MNKNYRRSFLLTIAVMAFIFLQSSFPADLSGRESGVIVAFLTRWLHTDPDGTVFVVRKCAHYLEYLALGVCLAQTLRYRTERRCDGTVSDENGPGAHPFQNGNGSRHGDRLPKAGDDTPAMEQKKLRKGYLLSAWCIGTLYAVTDELHQILVPGRSCEARDVLIDSVGILTGIFLVILVMRVKKRGKNPSC